MTAKQPPTPRTASARFPFVAPFLPLALAFTEQAATASGFSGDDVSRLVLAVEEVYSFYLDQLADTAEIDLALNDERYQLRLDAAPGDRHSYTADFQTSGDWQEIVLPFADFAAGPAPSRYPGRTLARVQIGAPAAPFRLEIDRIWLE